MKKQLIITGLTSIMLLGGGQFIYQSYAAEDTGAQHKIQEAQSDKVPEIILPTAELVSDPTRIDISEVSAEDIHVPSVGGISTKSQNKIFSQKTDEHGLFVRTNIYTETGNTVRFTQADLNMDKDAVLESINNSYKNESVEIAEMNGNTVAYVDGESRDVVHLITLDHFYSIAGEHGLLEELLDIAKKIQD
ncbi:hypothetical protein [Paenibacillus sp. An7]|uniref:hypothetical protein n=1 Tax=Paenibacillus sp. An7 TaxID=2689577 RepID=UPI001358E2E0|nr:hypothetical protein [Paenibacillus sp. An7]